VGVGVRVGPFGRLQGVARRVVFLFRGVEELGAIRRRMFVFRRVRAFGRIGTAAVFSIRRDGRPSASDRSDSAERREAFQDCDHRRRRV
jgi:hypothetical protein